jgi:MinD superfamily P-loop ATPase
VVVNRAGLGFDGVHNYYHTTDLPILAEIPYDRIVAETYARGHIVAKAFSWYRDLFLSLAGRIRDLASPVEEARYA